MLVFMCRDLLQAKFHVVLSLFSVLKIELLLPCLRRTILYSPDSRNMKNIPSKICVESSITF